MITKGSVAEPLSPQLIESLDPANLRVRTYYSAKRSRLVGGDNKKT